MKGKKWLAKLTKKSIGVIAVGLIMGASTVTAFAAAAGASGETVSQQVDSTVYQTPATQNGRQKVLTTGMASGEQSFSNSTTTNSSVSSGDKVNLWVPYTPEEKRLYSYVGNEAVTVKSADSKIKIEAVNSVQGVLCHKAFEKVLDGYEIGRTYNLFANGSDLKNPVYEIPQEVTITMTIPREMQKAGRSFKMICVSENGETHVLENVSQSNDSVMFSTKYFYAYALCYKD